MFEGLSYPQKLREGFRPYISYFYYQEVYVMKISSDVDNFTRSYGIKISKKRSEMLKEWISLLKYPSLKNVKSLRLSFQSLYVSIVNYCESTNQIL